MNIQNIPVLNMKKKITLDYLNLHLWDFSKNKFDTAVVNKPSVFKALKAYCIW